jgi:sigma-B regulation protein RsbU (phosphoserine phosphatase)
MKPELIRRVPLFSSLPNSEIENLTNTLELFECPPQTVILREGESGDRFYYLLDGEVEIVKALGTPDEHVMVTRKEGNFLGEMSLFSKWGAHTASVRAVTDLQLIVMTRANFDALLYRQPQISYEIAGLISRRLEQSENLTILDLKEKNRQLEAAYNELRIAQAQIIEKEKLEHEMEIARKIQRSILPNILPGRKGLDFGALMVPARAVGGDFYSFINLKDGSLGVFVGDVSDKGVPAAIFMALTFSLISAEASRTSSPADVLRNVNEYLLTMNASDMFVTLLYGILDCKTGNFNYARAGHLIPIIIDYEGNSVEVPVTSGQALGLFDPPLIDEQIVTIPRGGLALLISDGLSEASDEQGNEFGYDRLKKALSEHQDRPAQGICEQLWEAIQTHTGSSHLQDDFTALIIKREK